MGKYDHLERDTLVRLLERRDAERQLGLVWEQGGLETKAAENRDYVALDFDADLSHGEAPWQNLVIEGDNYDALRALRLSHAGRIACIYIDPPYNTGNRDFVYNDRFVDKAHRFRHSLWLEFMHKRLVLARELLADDGVIFVSIDDNELFRLGMLMDRVFGESNFVDVFSWVRTRTPAAPAHKTKKVTEYVLCYERSRSDRKYKGIEKPVQSTNPLLNQPNRIARLNFPSGSVATKLADRAFEPGEYGTARYKIKLIEPACVKAGKFVTPLVIEGKFRWSQEYLEDQLRSGVRVTIAKETLVPSYEKDSHGREALPNLIDENVNVFTNEAASSELNNVFGGEWVGLSEGMRSKPTSLIQYLVGAVCDSNDTILDFFAGSGTTAHAVAKLNAEDGGTRRFILVSSTEATEDQPDKNLCRDICAERVRRVLGGYTNAKGEQVEGLGGGFAYLRARRIAPHRLATRIAHGEVWHALQLIHDRALSTWAGRGFQHDGALGYLADFRAASIKAMHAWLGDTRGAGRTLYSWTPERIAALAPEADVASIPDFLKARFGR
ncbi:MAG: site-specific DNA-methyltransferase [Rhodanobacteraceae bacterium]